MNDLGDVRLIDGKIYNPWSPSGPAPSPATVAYGLSHLCRYGGHVRRFYSVAEHTIWVALYLACGGSDNLEFQLAADALAVGDKHWVKAFTGASLERARDAIMGLVHDAPEGCGLGDMIGPILKYPEMDPYKAAHERCLDWICGDWGLPISGLPKAVKDADRGIRGAEMSVRPLGALEDKPAWYGLWLSNQHDLSLLGFKYVREQWVAAYDALKLRIS